MKRRITLSIALVVSVVLLSLMSSDSTAKAQPSGLRRIADTGIVTLVPGQIIRLTITGGTETGHAGGTYQFRQSAYMSLGCNSDGVCKHAISSQIESAMITLLRGEGASFDIPSTAFGVRGVVLSNRPNVRVTAIIVDTFTGNVVAFANTTFDDQAVR